MKKIQQKWQDTNFLTQITAVLEAIEQGNPVIRQVDLSGIEVGPNAPIDLLRKKYLHSCTLQNVDLSHTKICGSMSESRLEQVKFEKAALEQVTLYHSQIRHCEFKQTKVVANFDDAVFEDCHFDQAKFTAGRLGLEYGGRRVRFEHCHFQQCLFRGVELRAVKFINCHFENTEWHRCLLQGVRFEGGTPPKSMQFVQTEFSGMAQLKE